MKILIIEDEISIAKPTAFYLEKHGFLCDIALNLKEAKSKVELNSYNALLLDINLPDGNGFDFAKDLRNNNFTAPIIMLTARHQMKDKILGLNNGADDYITKPFDMNELVARVNAQIRKYSPNQNVEFNLDSGVFHPEQNKFTSHNGNEITLSNKESQILEYLLRKRGSIITAETLIEHVWESDVNPFTQTLKTHIKTLRAKIDPEHKLILTIRGKGYTIENE